MKSTYRAHRKPELPAGHGEPIPELQIVPVPEKPAYEPPAAVINQRIPQHGPLPGELPPPSKKPWLN